MTGRNIVIVGACVAGLLFGGLITRVLPKDAVAAFHTETATFVLG
ncbi:MAG: hypothetical protein PHY29_05915 [Syntrophales bacterium]|nr:hypothetical protein [Syntrophales bacterium]